MPQNCAIVLIGLKPLLEIFAQEDGTVYLKPEWRSINIVFQKACKYIHIYTLTILMPMEN
jgi:hypothetical protein